MNWSWPFRRVTLAVSWLGGANRAAKLDPLAGLFGYRSGALEESLNPTVAWSRGSI
jgi:hypothetical protein